MKLLDFAYAFPPIPDLVDQKDCIWEELEPRPRDYYEYQVPCSNCVRPCGPILGTGDFAFHSRELIHVVKLKFQRMINRHEHVDQVCARDFLKVFNIMVGQCSNCKRIYWFKIKEEKK